MADESIPQPLAPGNTDVQPGQANAPAPPAPAGFSDTPQAPPAPAGFSDTPAPEHTSMLDKAMNFGASMGAGVAQGGLETLHGASQLLKKLPGIGNLIPEEGIKAEGKLAENVDKTPNMEKIYQQNPDLAHAAKMIGYGGENLAEFMLGDEALKGLSLADKYKQISGVMGILGKSPRLMRAIQTGVDVGKAASELGPAEQEAIKNSPILSRLVSAGMDAIRQGTVQGAQTAVKTGGDVKKAVEEGATTGVASGVLGGAFGMLGRAAEKAGEAGKAVQAAGEAAKAAPSKLEIGQNLANQINDAETKMHGDFEAGIQKLKGDLGDQKVAYAGSPLQKAATEAMEGRADVPSQKTTTLGTAFKGIAGGSDKTLKMLTDLTQPNKTGDLTIDELVQRRQQLGQAIGNILKGSTSAEDRADVAVYQKLRDGIDDTIDSLAKNSGKPEASQDYSALRGAYKDKVKLFNSPALQALSAPGVAGDIKLDNAMKYLFAGGNKIDKVNTLTSAIGEDGVKNIGKSFVQSLLADSSKDGQINPAKFVKNFKQIDNLPPEVKEKLFDMDAVNDGLGKLAGDLKSAANYQKLVRGGVLGAAGTGGTALLHSPIGIVLGLGGTGDIPGVTGLLDKIANHPAMWGALRGVGKAGEKAAASPVAQAAKTAAVKGTGSALNSILQGASEPLSSPIQQDQGVYTNQ